MQVLLYEDPLTDKNDLTWRFGHLRLDAAIYHSLVNSGHRCQMLTNEFGAEVAAEAQIAPEDCIAIPEQELIDALPHPQERIHHLFHERHYYDFNPSQSRDESLAARIKRSIRRAIAPPTPQQAKRAYADATLTQLAEVFRRHLAGTAPDWIVTWYPIPYLRQLFPHSKILYKEAGFFGTAPFPWSHYFDPCGFHAHSWMRRFPERAIAPEGIPFVQQLRDYFLPIIRQASPFRASVDALRSRYARLVLVALQANQYYLFDQSCPYRSQAHVLLDILRQLPPDTAVIPTLHPGHGTLTADELATIRRQYPNCEYLPETERFMAPSQYLLPDVDAVITLGSAVGWHALFHQKPLLIIADCHLSRAATYSSIAQLCHAWNHATPPPIDDAHLAWIMFHYSIPQSLYQRPDFAASILQPALTANLPNYFNAPIRPYAEITQEILATSNSQLPIPK
ncbi:capsular polysaccharide export protein, LipB/KpsS family [Tuwongella immobilis]|uniref:Capsule polysaccharide biosynthesis protein n=1 Tax=Tuwongella immobilis TaxID=692036 RepID=A0A6C2YVY8_9BACT|nr:hypothetical protein [Tuwongella immobilis]VIP05065.1 glycosyl transferase family 2 : Glycosyl transferase family 2 OS=Alicycliphilus denitrificans (strain DSM 18852 / JCM 14587 / BC) GN=Alide_3864 PE=4 SV=1: Capsule_synth [Tuwongella immobilis]VTS07486.1 glycosyl transferase family 2 : Glycosyl transferase family 2 OS=Alicycliphilus denitrificans (strain DSM 18852 / JCM 14587 / BC) GN=Alide_3864 PE=4 SV=1: Capsule_synth [Tuwongella immobilis]